MLILFLSKYSLSKFNGYKKKIDHFVYSFCGLQSQIVFPLRRAFNNMHQEQMHKLWVLPKCILRGKQFL